MRNRQELPVAVIDSGVGGISVLRELVKIMPNEDFLYLGDSANAPYGSRTKSEVLDITRRNLAALRARGIKALVIACNTATSAAATPLRAENPDLPIIGIEPAIKPAAFLLPNPRVLVMATPLTLREEKFRALVARFADREEIISLPCPGLVELIESGQLDGEDIERYLTELFAPIASIRSTPLCWAVRIIPTSAPPSPATSPPKRSSSTAGREPPAKRSAAFP